VASIHAQKNRSGNTYRVLWRQDGRQRSLTFENLPSAERFYLTEHITLGYATTVHAAQGVTTDTCHAILGEGASSRAMAYVAMTRGRQTNHAYLYHKLNHEADHHHATPIAKACLGCAPEWPLQADWWRCRFPRRARRFNTDDRQC